MVEFAVVKVFWRGDRNYGFAAVLDDNGNRTGEEIFIHASHRSRIIEHEGAPAFLGSFRVIANRRTRNVQFPEKGDEIVFERKPGKSGKGPKGSPWGFASSWRAMEEEINKHPLEDKSVSTTEVYNRAFAHFGNHEMAREATEMYPGDFI